MSFTDELTKLNARLSRVQASQHGPRYANSHWYMPTTGQRSCRCCGEPAANSFNADYCHHCGQLQQAIEQRQERKRLQQIHEAALSG